VRAETVCSSQASSRLRAAQPTLVDVCRAADGVGVAGRWLLHAGPPLRDPCDPPAVLMASAVLSCLHEGWAADETGAERLVRAGRVMLRPAQDAGCVTPLAALIGPGTPVLVVRDAARPEAAVHAPLSPLRGSDTRMGRRDPAVLEALRARDDCAFPQLARELARTGPLDLWACAAAGLAAGDDLHSVTTGATQALARRLDLGLPAPAWTTALAAAPLFFLTAWMAAARCMLQALEGADGPAAVTRGGGNGEVFGLSLAGAPTRWHLTPATAPQGPRLPDAPPAALACPAIGDSAVIDLLGLGAQALGPASSAWAALGTRLPAGLAQAREAWAIAGREAEPGVTRRLGVDAARVAADGPGPVIALAMIDAAGHAGLLGRGLMQTPATLYAQAAAALVESQRLG
jgi:hypothetical protein